MGEKDKIYWAVLNTALNLDFKKGHQRWTMSELARLSKVKRPLIYYYFGKSKIQILEAAVGLIGEELFGLNQDRVALWNANSIAESVGRTRQLLQQSPALFAFYLVHRTGTDALGQSIRKLESEYQKKLKRFFPKADEATVEIIFALLLGLVIAPKLSAKATEAAVAQVVRMLNR